MGRHGFPGTAKVWHAAAFSCNLREASALMRILTSNYYNNYYTHTQCKVQIYNSNVNFKENYHVARKYARIIIIAIIIIT